MRKIILDTETTGLSPQKGDRIVEVGCVEMIDRKITGQHLHYYINPERDIPEEVVRIHGIDNEKVKDSPKFREIASDLWDWLEGAELIIHNAAFDMGFLNSEFAAYQQEAALPKQTLESVCAVLDTLKLAREKFPGAKATLDALCKRYQIDNSHRVLHGALLDAEILADVYLMLTGGQKNLLLLEEDSNAQSSASTLDLNLEGGEESAPLIPPSPDELEQHRAFLELIANKSDKTVSW